MCNFKLQSQLLRLVLKIILPISWAKQGEVDWNIFQTMGQWFYSIFKVTNKFLHKIRLSLRYALVIMFFQIHWEEMPFPLVSYIYLDEFNIWLFSDTCIEMGLVLTHRKMLYNPTNNISTNMWSHWGNYNSAVLSSLM